MEYIKIKYLVPRFGYGADYRWRRSALGIHQELYTQLQSDGENLIIILRVDTEQATIVGLKYGNVEVIK